ncbi:MAG: hypothetical protein HIU92_04610 [Proteobacteria bacterium]|nr:hypothetical protein [Pseudomonadota bacterium]
MLRYLSRGIITAALTLMWLAVAWVVVDLVFADPAILVFEDIAILCAVLAPILYLIGWGLRWCDARFMTGTPRRA